MLASGSNPLDCGCDDDACASLPSAFLRLRFYLGKPMGVADFNDLQFYPQAKIRFHEQRLHGVGVVLGLGASVFSGSTTVLRVARGAAIDRCGREIVVGLDQCIDVAAWMARELARRQAIDPATTWPATDLDANGKLPLRVVLRYRECAVSPEAAPRDPCGCDDNGCEFGRVREGFELDLMTKSDAQPYAAHTTFPARSDLDSAVAQAIAGGPLDARLRTLVTTGSDDHPDDQGWLVIAGFLITLDTHDVPTAIDPDPSARAQLLLETGAMQHLLLKQLAASFEPGALTDAAPAIFDAALAQDKVTATTYAITLKLSAPILGTTLAANASQFSWTPFDPTTGWGTAATGLTAAYDATKVAIVITKTGGDVFLGAGGLFRLALLPNQATPIVDASMRPMLPLRFAWDFNVTRDVGTGAVTVSRAPFAV